MRASKYGIIFLFIAGLISFFPVLTHAEQSIKAYYFYNETCSHCHEEALFLDSLKDEYEELDLVLYDVVASEEARDLFDSVREAFLKKNAMTPFLVIGGTAFIGFSEQTETDIRQTLTRYQSEQYVDVVAKIIANQPLLPGDIEVIRFSPGDFVALPILGTVPIDSLSLFLGAVVLGFVDGFNPCALWILIFLISLLIHQRDRRRMWLLGLTFLLTSALCYFIIMTAWLQIAFSIAGIIWIRVIIGLFAFVFGLLNLFRYYKNRKDPVGCSQGDVTKRMKIQERIRHLIAEKNLLFAMLGIAILAIGVNLIELSCSAGLPLLYTQILAYNDLPAFLYYVYILVYVFVFLLDDILVFSGAMITLRISGISARYSRYSHLVGGIIMIIIGLLLLLFPNIILFS
jgi:thiol-disulfide isomerase/thioredoxin